MIQGCECHKNIVNIIVAAFRQGAVKSKVTTPRGCKSYVLGLYPVAYSLGLSSHARLHFSFTFKYSLSVWSCLKGLADITKALEMATQIAKTLRNSVDMATQIAKTLHTRQKQFPDGPFSTETLESHLEGHDNVKAWLSMAVRHQNLTSGHNIVHCMPVHGWRNAGISPRGPWY